jgi:hypothetical protein
MKNITPADFIADLYECRASVGLKPQKFQEIQGPQEMLKYNWLNTIIANLTARNNRTLAVSIYL